MRGDGGRGRGEGGGVMERWAGGFMSYDNQC